MAVASGNGVTVTFESTETELIITKLSVNYTVDNFYVLKTDAKLYLFGVFDPEAGSPPSEVLWTSSVYISLTLKKTSNGLLNGYTVTGSWSGRFVCIPLPERTVVGRLESDEVYEMNTRDVNIPYTVTWKYIEASTNTAEDSPLLVDGKTPLTVKNTAGFSAGRSGYKYSVMVTILDEPICEAEDTNTERNFEIPINALEKAQRSGLCHVSLYYNETLLTTASCAWYMKPALGVADIENVTFAVTPVSDTVPAEWSGYVQGKSHAHTEADASILYGDLTFDVTVGEKMLQGKSLDFADEVQPGEVQCSLTVTDAWGRTEKRQHSFNVWPYAVQVIESIKAVRCDESGSEMETGTSYKASAVTVYSDCGGHNIPTLTLYSKLSSETEYALVGPVPLGGELIVPDGAPDVEKSYDVCFVLVDTFNTVRYYAAVMTGNYFMYFKRGGKGVAVGKAAEFDNLFDIGYGLRVRGDTMLEGELTIFRPDGSTVTMTQILEALGL